VTISSTSWLQSTIKSPKTLILILTLLAFGLRLWSLDTVPPGWRDDELINSLVISQKVLDGDLSVYYADASGHEALYHLMNAVMLALFGAGIHGIRWLSVILGTLSVPITYLVANRLFGRIVALLAAAALTLSFWSLMYSRIGIRHISLPLFMLAAFYFFLVGLDSKVQKRNQEVRNRLSSRKSFIIAGLLIGVGFYTYFASRGAPIILLLFCGYLWLFQAGLMRRHWRGIMLTFGLAAVLAVPLVTTLLSQPDSEARVQELAVPLLEARNGNFRPLGENTVRTLSMVHGYGDDEWLYNIPFRPLFGPPLTILFWIGVVYAAWHMIKPVIRLLYNVLAGKEATRILSETPHLEAACAFLLIWWLVGISPAFVSVPAASLGHTIVAQSAVYILVVLPILPLVNLLERIRFKNSTSRVVIVAGFSLILLVGIAWRDLPDYFVEWPSRGMARFLYRGDIKDLADYLNENPELTDFAVSGLLAGPWDRIALNLDLGENSKVRPRWYNPENAMMLRIAGEPALSFSEYPRVSILGEELYERVDEVQAGGYRLNKVIAAGIPNSQPECFVNGLCLLAADYHSTDHSLDLTWEVCRPVDLPQMALFSNPPPPGVYSGPRLLVFAQLIDESGKVLAGDDGFWVDASTLYPGDRFLQRHWLSAPEDSRPALVIFGLYDPMTSERITTEDGRDHLSLEFDG
jgi:4-amino-4-deoxy-L-arabinose transferase-like glycosyltransferase